MKEILKKLLEILKAERELAKYKATLVRLPICYEALQAIINTVEVTNTIIEIKQNDGTVITIKKEKEKVFKTFKQKFEESKKTNNL